MRPIFLKFHVGELSLLEAHPPLVGLVGIASINLLEEANADFDAELGQILTDGISLLGGGRLRDVSTEGELGIAGQSEVLLQTHSSDESRTLLLVLLEKLGKARRDVQDTISQETISITLDGKVAEQNVGLEKCQNLINEIGYSKINGSQSQKYVLATFFVLHYELTWSVHLMKMEINFGHATHRHTQRSSNASHGPEPLYRGLQLPLYEK